MRPPFRYDDSGTSLNTDFVKEVYRNASYVAQRQEALFARFSAEWDAQKIIELRTILDDLTTQVDRIFQALAAISESLSSVASSLTGIRNTEYEYVLSTRSCRRPWIVCGRGHVCFVHIAGHQALHDRLANIRMVSDILR